MVLEAGSALEGLEHGLDPLPDPAEGPEPGPIVLAARSEQVGAEVFADEPFDVPAGEALVPQEHLAVLH